MNAHTHQTMARHRPGVAATARLGGTPRNQRSPPPNRPPAEAAAARSGSTATSRRISCGFRRKLRLELLQILPGQEPINQSARAADAQMELGWESKQSDRDCPRGIAGKELSAAAVTDRKSVV